jgi:hypothetical protein
MSDSIYAVTAVSSVRPVTTRPPAPEPIQQAQAPRTVPDEDSVTLSEDAQVSQMDRDGASPATISLNLGIPIAAVNLDLGTATMPAPTKPAAESVLDLQAV